jgi:hypothetical protein
MARRDEVDIVAAAGLERKHHSRAFFGCYLIPQSLLAELPVLAINTAQAAPAEKMVPEPCDPRRGNSSRGVARSYEPRPAPQSGILRP